MTRRLQQRAVFSLLTAAIALIASCSTRVAKSTSVGLTPTVNFCDLINNPARYDGKNVVVRASLRSSFEYSELFCLACPGRGSTWPDFVGDDEWKGPRRDLRRIPSVGISNGTFSGIFESSKGPYGHMNLYQFRLVVDSVSGVSIVSRSEAPPLSLPNEIQQKMCH